MSATTLVLAVVVVILLYLLFKKYASAAPTTEQIRSESQSSMIDENREESVQPNEGDKKIKNQVESGEQKRKTDLEDNNNNNGKSMSSVSDEQNLNVKNGDKEVRKRNMKGAGKGGGSKEWGPMGKQKMRDVPPWKMEGDVYFPPNFWIEEKRSKQSDRQL